MTHDEFVSWLDSEVSGGRMTPAQRKDMLEQKATFDGKRPSLETEHSNQIVAVVASEVTSGWEIHALLDAAKAKYPGRMIYFEPIGFDLL